MKTLPYGMDCYWEEMMKKIMKMFICLTAVLILVSGCSSKPDGGNAVLEFFGFNSSAKEQPAAGKNQAQTAQNSPQADKDPFGVESHSGTGTGTSMSNLDWDDFDPALVEQTEPDTKSKSGSSVQDDWENDPDAWSFSTSSFDSDTDSLEQKQVPFNPNQNNPNQNPNFPSQNGTNQRPPAQPNPRPQNPYQRPAPGPGYNFYRIQDCPVFCPVRMLPHTGITTGMSVDIKESVSYTSTNMSLSIPGLNVTEDIVVVPLVDDNYPVEALGEKIGLLEGSGPGPEDLFVLVGHNHIDMQEPGPFLELSALKESDLIFVNGAKNASRTFVVYANEKFDAADIEGLLSYAKPGCMILITCEDESIDGGYLNRRVIFAEAKEN